jgi:hypothetical protein
MQDEIVHGDHVWHRTDKGNVEVRRKEECCIRSMNETRKLHMFSQRVRREGSRMKFDLIGRKIATPCFVHILNEEHEREIGKE